MAVGGTQRGTSHNSGSCAGPKVLGLILEGGKHGAGVMPGISVGMDQGAMPKVAMADTSECVAEQS